jgi:hypothetical protein
MYNLEAMDLIVTNLLLDHDIDSSFPVIVSQMMVYYIMVDQLDMGCVMSSACLTSKISISMELGSR